MDLGTGLNLSGSFCPHLTLLILMEGRQAEAQCLVLPPPEGPRLALRLTQPSRAGITGTYRVLCLRWCVRMAVPDKGVNVQLGSSCGMCGPGHCSSASGSLYC